MSSVVSYQNTDKQCFCQIKFDSGERVLVSIASRPTPSVKIVQMALSGLVPRGAVWEFNAVMAGSVGAYAQNLMRMFPPNARESAHPLDVIKDALLQCRSIAECQSLLAARQRHVQAPQSDVLTLYGDLLQQVGMIEPESSLPAPKNVIKAAIIEEARHLSARGEHKGVETLRTCYSLLSGFVSDEVAARNQVGDGAASEIDGLQPEDLLATNEEARRLVQEFDSQVTPSERGRR
jgi:hypothetical protein